MSATIASMQHDFDSHPWIAELAELKPIEGVDPRALQTILDIWLEVFAPDTRLIEPEAYAGKIAVFRRRDDLRRFIKAFRARKIAKLPASLPV